MSFKSKNKANHFEYLSAGDTVDIVAPGSACTVEQLEKAVLWLKNQGYQPRFPADILSPKLYLSHSDEKRFKYLVDALKNKDSKAVWCLRGGYGSIRLIPQLLKMKPILKQKLFIGYSDITTLHLFLNNIWKWPTLHGPVLEACGQEKLSEANKNELISVLENKKKQIVFSNLKLLNTSLKKNVTAPIMGGNLCVYASAIGTKIFPPKKDHILFFEDIDERGYKVDRYLNQIEQAGGLKKCKAIVFGQFTGGNEANGQNHIMETIINFAAKLKIPVLSGIEAGHGRIQRPLFFKTKATLVLGTLSNLTVFNK